MNEWNQYPTANTALDDILPCVDNATAQETLLRSKEVTSELVNLVNQVITNVSNINFAPNFTPLYYNQSGPLMPLLCDPFRPDMTDRQCDSGEVNLSNATQVHKLNLHRTRKHYNALGFVNHVKGLKCLGNHFLGLARVNVYGSHIVRVKMSCILLTD
jgi:hypothetical protein